MTAWTIYIRKNASEWRPVKTLEGPAGVDEWIRRDILKTGNSPYDYTAAPSRKSAAGNERRKA